MEENQELAVVADERIKDLASFGSKGNTEVGTFTNIFDKKEVFNLQTSVDEKLNNCEGEKIRVKKVLIRTFDKPLKEPVIDEETGEIIKSFERNISCVLVDDTGKSYATGSKTFTYNLIRYLKDCDGAKDLEKDGIELQILKVPTPTGNKALSFKII